MYELIELLKDWAKDAWNWLKKFFRSVWGKILRLWSRLRQWVNDKLRTHDEVIITKKGSELYDVIKKMCPEVHSNSDFDEEGLVTMNVNNGSIDEIEIIDVTTEQKDKFEETLEREQAVRISDI